MFGLFRALDRALAEHGLSWLGVERLVCFEDVLAVVTKAVSLPEGVRHNAACAGFNSKSVA